MSTCSTTLPNTNNFNLFPKLICIASLILVASVVVQLGFHALQRGNASEVEQVHQCLSKNGTWQVWKNPVTGRVYQVCNNGDWFGIQVIVEEGNGIWREITAFIRKTSGKPVLDPKAIAKYLLDSGAFQQFP